MDRSSEVEMGNSTGNSEQIPRGRMTMANYTKRERAV
jgi:hypothetical protein